MKPWVWKLISSVIIVAVGCAIAMTVLGFDFGALGAALLRLDPGMLAAALGFGLLQILLQVGRLGALVAKENWPGLFVMFRAVAFGQLLNGFAPMRAGDAYLAMAVSQASKKSSLSGSVSIILSERISDTLALFVLGFLSQRELLLRTLSQGTGTLGLVAGAVAFVAAGALLVLRRQKKAWSKVSEFGRHFSDLIRSPRFFVSFAFAMAAWVCSIFALSLILGAAGVELSFARVSGSVVLLNIGIAIPITVANVGIFEATLAYALGHFGVESVQALAAASVFHFLLALALVIWALVALLVTVLQPKKLVRR